MNNKINKIFSLIERMEHRPLGSLLNESQESTSQKEAIRYIEQKKVGLMKKLITLLELNYVMTYHHFVIGRLLNSHLV